MDFTFIGADPGLGHMAGVSCFPYFESYEKYQDTVLEGDFSIGLAPAYDTPFYACKYYNKFIEYSSCGIAGVYGACAPYTQIVRDGENGILCGSEPANWYLALRRLLEEPQIAVQYAANAADLLERRFTHASVSARLQEGLPELTEFHKEERTRKQIPLPSMRLLFYSERIRLLCRMYGLLAGFVIVFKAVKKLVNIIRNEWRSE